MSDSCNSMDCSLLGSSVHGILQARILGWVAISFSTGSSQPRDWTQVSCIDKPRQHIKIRDITLLTKIQKSYNQPTQHIKKPRHYFTNKGPYSQSYGFSSSRVQMWTVKKAKHWTIAVFELWSWKRLLRVPWPASRSK